MAIRTLHLNLIMLPYFPSLRTQRVSSNLLTRVLFLSVKGAFRRPLIFRIFENIKACRISIYTVDFLTEIRWITRITIEWRQLDAQCLSNVFRNRFESDTNSQYVQETRAAFTEQFMRDVTQHQLPSSRMGIENLLNPTEEKNVVESIITESQLKFIIGNTDDTENNTGLDDDDEVYTTAEDFKVLAIATALLERRERKKTGAQSIKKVYQRELRLDKQGPLRQTSIHDHCKFH